MCCKRQPAQLHLQHCMSARCDQQPSSRNSFHVLRCCVVPSESTNLGCMACREAVQTRAGCISGSAEGQAVLSPRKAIMQQSNYVKTCKQHKIHARCRHQQKCLWRRYMLRRPQRGLVNSSSSIPSVHTRSDAGQPMQSPTHRYRLAHAWDLGLCYQTLMGTNH